MSDRLKFGVFLDPYHPATQNPTRALQRDLELIELLDRLGFDEAWFGEHHSGGWEIISSPEIMMAAAAQRTRRIKLGTGVNSLPFHHPFILADRWMLLDHLLQGRAMFGAGPGVLPSDSYQMGIDPMSQRPRLHEALEAIVALFRAEEPVTRHTDWFTLQDARLQLRSFSDPVDIRVAAMTSPTGPQLAGRHGLGMLSVGATVKSGFSALKDAWAIAEHEADANGQTVDRSRWSLVGPMHLAETERQAREEVRYGLSPWVDYFKRVTPLPLGADANDVEGAIDELNEDFAVIGTPEMAIEQISRLQEQTGGFGCFLLLVHQWASPQATDASYELFTREVMPHFQGQTDVRVASFEWVEGNVETFRPQFAKAQEKATQEYRPTPTADAGTTEEAAAT